MPRRVKRQHCVCFFETMEGLPVEIVEHILRFAGNFASQRLVSRHLSQVASVLLLKKVTSGYKDQIEAHLG